MPKRKSAVKLQERPRNLLTLAPIMQKGGAHGKSDKALRRAERQHTQMSAREEFSSRGDDLILECAILKKKHNIGLMV